jgi:hypothetical protein
MKSNEELAKVTCALIDWFGQLEPSLTVAETLVVLKLAHAGLVRAYEKGKGDRVA